MTKKALFTLALAGIVLPLAAQDITQYNPGSDEGIVYFLPQTALEVNVIATNVSYQPGEFCQYANRYLRLNNVSSAPETHWELKQIDVRSIGVADSTKAYIVKLKDKSQLSNIELTDDGVIKAINTTNTQTAKTQSAYKLEKDAPAENARQYMTEEILMAGSTAKMAELTAKEIYNIRESKNQILRGQADEMPKDGASLKLVIENLDKQEKAMTQMFSGTTQKEDKLFTVRIIPQGTMKDRVAIRFSQLLGIVSSSDLSGEPVYISLANTSSLTQPIDDGKKKKKLEGAIYNIPGKGKVTVSFQGKTLFEGETPVTQFGYTEVLTSELFNKKLNTRVTFNPETGGILKIDKD